MRILFLIAIFFSQLGFSSDNNYVFGWTQLDNPDLMTPRGGTSSGPDAVSYTHLRAHETGRNLVCRLLLEKKGHDVIFYDAEKSKE